MRISQFVVQLFWAAIFANGLKFECTELFIVIDECDGGHTRTQNNFQMVGKVHLIGKKMIEIKIQTRLVSDHKWQLAGVNRPHVEKSIYSLVRNRLSGA